MGSFVKPPHVYFVLLTVLVLACSVSALGAENTVDLEEFTFLSLYWGQSGLDLGAADFSGDGTVDETDLGLLGMHWLEEDFSFPVKDSYEFDDSDPNASLIGTDAAAQSHSIYPLGDEDWLKFTITSTVASIVVIETSGAEGDTEIRLYDDGDLVAAAAYDDDSGSGQFSKIEGSFAPGTYYLRINEKSGAETMSEYFVSVLAYEFPDLVVNGVVDGEDLAFMSSYWLQSGSDLTADINGDGTVNIKDFGLLSAHWLEENIPWISIAGGTFSMGGELGDQLAVHTVTLSDFAISKYETTNGQYAEYLNAALTAGEIKIAGDVVYAADDDPNAEPYFTTFSASSMSLIDYSDGSFVVLSKVSSIDGEISMDDFPVNEVSWFGAKAFCDHYGYKLPTEAQWEYAARGGNTDPAYDYPWDSDTADQSFANFYTDVFTNPEGLATFPYLSYVGYYGSYGVYGLCDMGGNVSEWCSDWYLNKYFPGDVTDPSGPVSGTERIIRGGAWSLSATACKVFTRDKDNPDEQLHNRGFRVCYSAPVEEPVE